MSSAEGLSEDEKNYTASSKLKLKIRLTKSGGFVSVSDCLSKADLSSTTTTYLNEFHHEQEQSVPLHQDFTWTQGHVSPPGHTSRKKARKKKQKNRQVEVDKCATVLNEYSPCAHDVSETSEALQINPLISIPPSYATTMDTVLNQSPSSVQASGVPLQPETSEIRDDASGTAEDSRSCASLKSDQVKKYLHVAGLPLQDKDVDENPGDDVDGSFQVTPANDASLRSGIMNSHRVLLSLLSKGQPQHQSAMLDQHLSSLPSDHFRFPAPDISHVTEAVALNSRDSVVNSDFERGVSDDSSTLTVDPSEAEGADAAVRDSEINNNRLESHASHGPVPSGPMGNFGSLSFMSGEDSSAGGGGDCEMSSQQETTPFAKMLLSRHLAKIMSTPKGNAAKSSLIMSTGAEVCCYTDGRRSHPVEKVTDVGFEKYPHIEGAPNTGTPVEAVRSTEPRECLMQLSGSTHPHLYDEGRKLPSKYEGVNGSPCDVIPAYIFCGSECQIVPYVPHLHDQSDSTSLSESHTVQSAERDSNAISRRDCSAKPAQRDKPGPVSSKRCRCKVPVPQETTDSSCENQGKQVSMCTKCMKRIPQRRPKKQSGVVGEKYKPYSLCKEHNYCRPPYKASEHLSLCQPNKSLAHEEQLKVETNQKTWDGQSGDAEMEKIARGVIPSTLQPDQCALKGQAQDVHSYESFKCGESEAGQIMHRAHVETCMPSERGDSTPLDGQAAECSTMQETDNCGMTAWQKNNGVTQHKSSDLQNLWTVKNTHKRASQTIQNDIALLDEFGMDPCYVVLERCRDVCRSHSRRTEPCPKQCREESLDFLCEVGNLTRCKHSGSKNSAFTHCDRQPFGVFDLKRNFLRHNKSLEGYEEYRQQQLQEMKMMRLREGGMCEDGHDTTVSSSMGMFYPLTSLCEDSAAKVQSSSSSIYTDQAASVECEVQSGDCQSSGMQGEVGEQGQEAPAPPAPDHPVESQRTLRSRVCQGRNKLVKSPAPRMTREKAHKQFCDNVVQMSTADAKVSDLQGCDKTVSGSMGREQLKMSKFDVKYYVFEAEGRAFVVPLIHSGSNAGSMKRLDDEDLHYVKTVISVLLDEESSCARHLGYEDSCKFKQKNRSSVLISDRCKPLMVGSYGEFHLECQKIVAGDPQVLNMVPQNNEMSEMERLQQLGEEVYMYLTGTVEDAPTWIREVAKKVITKARRRIQNRKRLKPSKDVTIEIDYAEEGGDIDVGEEEEEVPIQTPSMSMNVCESSADTQPAVTTSSFGGPAATEEQLAEVEGLNQRTGSFVSEEAYVQERKPLLSDLIQASQATLGDYSDYSGSGEMHPHGQHISVPLPPGFDPVQHGACGLIPGTGGEHTGDQVSSGNNVQTQGFEEEQDRKPLAHELVSLASVPVPLPVSVHPQDKSYTQLTEESQAQSTQEQNPALQYAVVKQEPPDDDYSFASSGGNQTETRLPVSEASSRPDKPIFPYITADMFGQGAVQLEQEPPNTPSEARNVQQLSAKTHASGREPALSQLSPWMVPDVDQSASGSVENQTGPSVTIVSRPYLAGQRIIILPRSEFLRAREVAASGCPEPEDECKDNDDDYEDYGEDELYVESDGQQVGEDVAANTDSSDVTSQYDGGLPENHTVADDGLPVISDVCGADDVDFAVETVVSSVNCDETSSERGDDSHTGDSASAESASDNAGLPVISGVVSGASLWSDEQDQQDQGHSSDLQHEPTQQQLQLQIQEQTPAWPYAVVKQEDASDVPFVPPEGCTFQAEGSLLNSTMGYVHVGQGIGSAIVKQEPVSPVGEHTAEFPGFPGASNHIVGSYTAADSEQDRHPSTEQSLPSVTVPPAQGTGETESSGETSLSLLGAEAAPSRALRTPSSKRKPRKTRKSGSNSKRKKRKETSAKQWPPCMDDTTSFEGGCEEGLTQGLTPGSSSHPLKEIGTETELFPQSPVEGTTGDDPPPLSPRDEELALDSLESLAAPVLDTKQADAELPHSAPDAIISDDQKLSLSARTEVADNDVPKTGDSHALSISHAAAPQTKKKRRQAKKGRGKHKKSRSRSQKPASDTTASVCACADCPEETGASLGHEEAKDSETVPSPAKKPKRRQLEETSNRTTKAHETSPSLPSVDRVTASLNSLLAQIQKAKEKDSKVDDPEATASQRSENTTVGSEGKCVPEGHSDRDEDVAPEAIGSTKSKPVQERSFFDCLPEDFLSAWKT